MRRLFGWSGITLLLGTLAFASGEQPGTQADAKQGAERLANALEQAWNQGQFGPLEQTLSKDLVFSNPSGQVMQGPDGMIRVMKQDRQAIEDRRTRFEVTRVDEIAPGVALADITHQFSAPQRFPNGTTSDHAQILAVLERKGDRYEARSLRVFVPVPVGGVGVGGAGTEGQAPDPNREYNAPIAPEPSMEPRGGE